MEILEACAPLPLVAEYPDDSWTSFTVSPLSFLPPHHWPFTCTNSIPLTSTFPHPEHGPIHFLFLSLKKGFPGTTTHLFGSPGRLAIERRYCHDFDISAAMTTLISDPQGPPTTSYDLAATLED